jgi:hypothetical protein
MNASDDERGPPSSDFSKDLVERLDNAPADERVYRTALELYTPTRVVRLRSEQTVRRTRPGGTCDDSQTSAC